METRMATAGELVCYRMSHGNSKHLLRFLNLRRHIQFAHCQKHIRMRDRIPIARKQAGCKVVSGAFLQ